MKKNEARKKGTAPVKSDGNGVEKSYAAWIADLKRRYRATQIKAAVAVNSALIEFYWNLGKDIAEKFAEEARYGSRFFEKVSFDMRAEFPNDSGFSPRNIRYCQDFYCLYSTVQILQQVVAKSASSKRRDHPRANLAQYAIRRDYEPQAALVPTGRMEVPRPPAALVAARLYFPLKCDKMHMFFDRGTMHLNGE